MLNTFRATAVCAATLILGASASMVAAVPYTSGSVTDTINTCVDTHVSSPELDNVCLDFVENEFYMRLLVYGYEVAPGQGLTFSWEADFWRGQIVIGSGEGSQNGEFRLSIGGEAQHTWPDDGEVFEFGGGLEAGPDDPDPSPGILLPVLRNHPGPIDRYSGDFRMSPGIVFGGDSAPSGVVGFLLDLEASHGPHTTSGDGTGLQLVPLPAGAISLLSALAAIFGWARFRRREKFSTPVG